jgi:hypothetical protein
METLASLRSLCPGTKHTIANDVQNSRSDYSWLSIDPLVNHFSNRELQLYAKGNHQNLQCECLIKGGFDGGPCQTLLRQSLYVGPVVSNPFIRRGYKSKLVLRIFGHAIRMGVS